MTKMSAAERARLQEAGRRLCREARANAGLPPHCDDPEILAKAALLLARVDDDTKRPRGARRRKP